MSKSTLVLYHGHCYDGFGSAYSAWKYFGDGAEYRAVSYGRPIPEDAKDRKYVFILDFSYPREELLALAEAGTMVVVLDHHKTAEENLRDLAHKNIQVQFDMNRSGAAMAWDYFHNTLRPELIMHIQDRDLWRFQMGGTKEVHADLLSYPMDFKLWDDLSYDIPKLKTEGVALTRMYQQLVAKVCERPWMREIGGYKVPTVNTSFAWSEVGEYLYNKFPNSPFVASFTEYEDCTMWSLRSVGEFDVSAVAKLYGGGGHKNASGFKVQREKQ